MLKRIMAIVFAVVLLSVSAFCFAEGGYGDHDTEHRDTLDDSVNYLKPVLSSGLSISKGYIFGVKAGTTESVLKTSFVNPSKVTVDGTTSNQVVKTGTVVKYNGGEIDAATVVISGDINCDGMVTVTDLTSAWLHISGLSPIGAETAEFAAADNDNNGTVNVVDIAAIRKIILSK